MPEKKRIIAPTRISGGGKQYIRVTEQVWESGFKLSEKTAMIEVEPGTEEQNAARVAALESGKLQVQFGNQNRNTGFYDHVLVAVGAAAPAEKAADTVETTA